ncbi:MAG: hypothetical protein AAF645_29395 [Myxococcota bacterium]
MVTETGFQNVRPAAAAGTDHNANDCGLLVAKNSMLHDLFDSGAQPEGNADTVILAHRAVAAVVVRAAKLQSDMSEKLFGNVYVKPESLSRILLALHNQGMGVHKPEGEVQELIARVQAFTHDRGEFYELNPDDFVNVLPPPQATRRGSDSDG